MQHTAKTARQVVADAAERAAEGACEGAKSLAGDVIAFAQAFGSIVASMWTRGIETTSEAVNRGAKPDMAEIGELFLKARDGQQSAAETLQRAVVLRYRLVGTTIEAGNLSKKSDDLCKTAAVLCDRLVSAGGSVGDNECRRMLERIAAAALQDMRK